jgi:imidazolonepropionase-like amidohydrolase
MRGHVLLLGLLLEGAAFAQDSPIAIVGATVLTGTGESIENGTIIIRGGKIESVSRGAAAPQGASIVDASGLFATPGLIDAYSRFGIKGENWDRKSLLAPGGDVLERFEPESDSPWLRSGVTSTYVAPGGQNLLGGYGAVVKLTGTVVRARAALATSFGETALDAFEAPTTRQGMIGLLRQTFIRAQEDATALEAQEPISRVLAKEIPLHALVNTPDDILTALRFAKEFDLRLVLVSAMGGHQVAPDIAGASVPVIVAPSIIGIGDGGPYEGFSHTPANAARLREAGVSVALSTFSSGGRSVALEGVMAKAHGLPRDAALAAVTRAPAAILGVGDRIGSLEAGKDADVVLWKGQPLTTWAQTQRVIVDGVTRFER